MDNFDDTREEEELDDQNQSEHEVVEEVELDETDEIEDEETGEVNKIKSKGNQTTNAINSEIGSIINNHISISLDDILSREMIKLSDNELKYKDAVDEREYRKVLAHIKNKLRDRDFVKAYQFCLQAEDMAPDEPVTWEYFTLTEFLRDLNVKDRKKRKPIREIVRRVKINLEKGRDHGLDIRKYDEICCDLANQLFAIQKSGVNSFRARSKDSMGKDIWTKVGLRACLYFLTSYEQCYYLCKDIRFLEEYVRELSKPHKWMVRGLDNELLNMPIYGDFSAINKRENLIRIIRGVKPDYEAPEIEAERFIVLPETPEMRITSIE